MPAWTRRVHRWLRGAPRVVFHAEYRLPIPIFSERTGFECRRAEMALETLLALGVLGERDILTPDRVGWDTLALVHGSAWLEALTHPEALAAVFAVDAADVPLAGLLDGIRRTVGGTVMAARTALVERGAVLNLAGGYHHARPERGAAYCPVNDIAVALAVVQKEGFKGDIAVLDLDAHPPDGTAACLAGRGWIGSISGSEWAAPTGVDEILLAPGTGDNDYLATLKVLLARMPRAALTFVIAGGDVRDGDRAGRFVMTELGVRRRDQMVFEHVHGRASAWLPAGGYRPDSWRVLAGTGLVLAGHPGLLIPVDFDPTHARFGRVGSTFGLADLGAEMALTPADVDETLVHAKPRVARLLGTYTAAGVELALERYGLLLPVRQLGYAELRVAVDATDVGDRFRLFGFARGAEHLLVETVLSRATVHDQAVLFVHWMTMRHPIARFTPGRPPLPGQDTPGLGLFRESLEVHDRMAERLGLAGVAMRPAYLHVWAAVRDWMVCADKADQDILDALFREHDGVPIPTLSRQAVAGTLRVGGKPFVWIAPLVVRFRTVTAE